MKPPSEPVGYGPRQFRVDDATWTAFMTLCGHKAAGSTLRKLMALYLDPGVPGHRLRVKVSNTNDPNPDRRPLPRAPRS